VRRGAALAGVLLAAVLAGCGTDPPVDETGSGQVEAAPSAPDLGDDAFVVRDRLLETVRAAGGVRVTVSGSPAETTLDLVRDEKRDRFARRFSWQEGAAVHEVLELRTRQVCLNLAASRSIHALGNPVMGAIVGSDRPYSCSDRGDSSVAGFVMFGNALRDPVGRLQSLMGDLGVTDLGVETDVDGVATRHVRLSAVESDSSLRQVPTTWDLWVDGDLRLVRAEFTSLTAAAEVHTARFDWDADVPAVTMPEDAGRLGSAPGNGIPGMGGYLVGQLCPEGPPCDGASPSS
jgi:hypothetical protein